jgi:predicted RND superfamily exporter protein
MGAIERYIGWVVRRRRIVIAAVLVITAAAAYGLKNLTFYNNLSDWLPKDDPKLALYVSTSEKFSTNALVLVMIKPHQGLFRRETLASLKAYTEELKEKPEVFSVTSLANVADIKKIPDGIEVANLLEKLPETEPEMRALETRVLSEEMFRNRVISASGEWTAASVFLNDRFDTVRTVKDVVIPVTEKFFKGGADLYYTGVPADGHFINRFTQRDLVTLVPIMIVAILGILYVNLRSWKNLLAPVLIVLLANIWLFGLIGYLHRPLTIIAPAVPVLLIALGSAYGIYIVNKIQHDAKAQGTEGKARIAASAAAVAIPILFAALTDIIGFLSFRGVKLAIVADFGLFAALGLVFALFLAVTFIPAFAASISIEKGRSAQTRKPKPPRFLEWAGRAVTRRPKEILAAFLAVFVLGAAGIPRLKREVGFSGFYAKGSPPRMAMDTANAQFDGAYPLAVDFVSENVRTPENLRIMRRLENYLLSLDGTGLPFSAGDLIEELNFRLNDRFAIPDRTPSIENLWLFIEGREELNQILSADGTEALVFTKISNPATAFNERLYRRMEEVLGSLRERGFRKIDLASVPPAEIDGVRKAEARFLADEIAWLARYYAKREISPDDIAARLTPLIKGIRTSDVAAELEQTCRLYLDSGQFPIDLDSSAKTTLLAALLREIRADSLTEESLGNLLGRILPQTAAQAGSRDDVRSALLFKIRETKDNIAVARTGKDLAALFRNPDPNLERRVQSVLFDLTDGLAVIAGDHPGVAAGSPIPIRRLDHTGYPTLLTKLSEFLFRSQIQSLLLAFSITLVLMIVMRRSVVLGLISMLPIAFAATVMYGLLGFVRIPLDYATMMIGSVSIGVGIDYTIHLIYVITDEAAKGASLETAIRNAFLERGRAILSNTLAVMAGFAILLMSSMILLRNFGGVMVLSMFLCFAAALTLLPVVLLLARPRALKKLLDQGGRNV